MKNTSPRRVAEAFKAAEAVFGPVAIANRQDTETRTMCPECGSDHVGSFCGDFPTGVVAPDGYYETAWEEGFECQNCGLRFDESGAEHGF